MVSRSHPRSGSRACRLLQACSCLLGIVTVLVLLPLPRTAQAAEPAFRPDRPASAVLPAGRLVLPHIGDEIAVALQDYRGAVFPPPGTGQGLQRRSEVRVESQAPVPQEPAADANGVRQRRALARSVVDLKRDYEQLARYHEQLQRKFEKLSLSNEQLLKRHEQLQQSVGDLVRYNKELQGNIAELKKTREQLRGSYDRLNGVYSELRRRGSDSGAFAVPPPSMRTFGETVPARAATNGEGYNNEVMRTGPAKFPPDFTN